jgi:hypothetical protein
MSPANYVCDISSAIPWIKIMLEASDEPSATLTPSSRRLY